MIFGILFYRFHIIYPIYTRHTIQLLPLNQVGVLWRGWVGGDYADLWDIYIRLGHAPYDRVILHT